MTRMLESRTSSQPDAVWNPRSILVRWHATGVLVAIVLAWGAALLDSRRNGPLSLQGNVWPVLGLVAIAAACTLPVSTTLTWGWLVAAQRRPEIERRPAVRVTGLVLLGLVQSLLAFSLGALLTGRFVEVWSITDRFSWLPAVPALIVLIWPIMSAWLLVPRLLVRSLRSPLLRQPTVTLSTPSNIRSES